MESLSSENKSIALDILEDILSAHHYFDVDADVVYSVISKELSPLKSAIEFFKEQLTK